jgi:MinD-like ATPase involved in chromosome partitioning or flagellar assembly
MSEYDSSPERRHGIFTADPSLDNSWPEAPEPSWLVDDVAEEEVDQTGLIPAYDLGPSTESFVVDLTGDQPYVHEALYQEAVDPVELTPRHSAPPESAPEPAPVPEPEAEPESVYTPPAAAPPVPAVRAIDRTAVEAPPTFDIPPVPLGSAQNQAETLTAATILRTSKPRPQSGWRKRVLGATGGRINFGPSPADRRRADLIERARTPVIGCHRVAVISLKGGVGKTTTTAALGAMFANLRGDRVIAVDANPDRGTLVERVPRQSGATVRHLLEARDRVTRYGDVRAFTSQSPTRLEVLASDSDPSASSALSEQDYRNTVDTLERFYNLILTDCGTGLLHDAMRGVLGLATSLVVVSSASLDGARSASATLDWLEAHGMEALAKDAVVVISSVRPGGGIVDVMQLEDHFAARCRAVVTIPYDGHLEAGGVLDLDELDAETLDAYKELAAAVGEGFAVRR